MIRFAAADSKQWNDTVTHFPEANFLQSWEWLDAHEALGLATVREIIINGDTPVGLIGGIVRNARRGRYIEIGGGPLVDWSDGKIISAMRDELKRLAREHRAVFVRIRPQETTSPALLSSLKALGFTPAAMHLYAEHTSVIDLTPDKDTLLERMRQQTRYEVRRIEKRGVNIGYGVSPADIDTFYELQHSTAERQQFIPQSKETLRAYAAAFGKSLRVYRAEKDGTLLNLALIIFYGNEADYFEAASTLEARKEPGAYGIIWQAMQDAKAAGIKRINLWGIAPDDNPAHRYQGVTIFKRGFGGTDVHFAPAHDLVVHKSRYVLNYAVETIRKKRRKL